MKTLPLESSKCFSSLWPIVVRMATSCSRRKIRNKTNLRWENPRVTFFARFSYTQRNDVFLCLRQISGEGFGVNLTSPVLVRQP